jgi:rhamnogalacturonyl hydrolase YesR/pectin methylesterase-like acyl-CoA thioesterase
MKNKQILMGCLGLMFSVVGMVQAQESFPKEQKPWSVRMAESEMVRNPESWQVDFQPSLKWDYCHGLELGAMMDVYDRYGDAKFYEYALAYADTMVNEDGTIKKYKLTDYSLDRINSGKMLFRIYEQTKNDKYKKALDLLRSQFDGQPRNADGGFWHKKVYPNQMWLDGLYMGTPFLAEYAYRNNEPQAYQEVINQIKIVARHTYDPANGLFRHACDVSKREKWADKETGQSQHCWGRALGWYMMAIVDDLDFIPQHEPGRDTVLVILNHIAETLKKYQSPEGLWYQVMDKSGEPGNYLESSCSAMFVYSLFKAVRKGYIPSSYFAVARKGYEGILNEFIKVDDNGLVSITKACAVAGLGGKNYRMGDYDYYIHEQIRDNDPKAVGPFILASLEWEGLPKEKRRFAEPRELVVAQDGTGDYTTIAEALEAVRAFMDFDVKIYIKKGIYKEKLVVPSWVQHIELIGEDVQNTIITHADHANMNHMGTFRTYTVKVEGNYITFRNITIENNAPRLGQAVALHTEGDCLRFINCRFLGNQDTVYTGVEGTRLYFENCYIEGTTDFIFGPSTAWFEGCTIHSKANSYITAASTPKDIEYGYIFNKCKLTATAGVDKVYLGRPWRPYAYTIFMNCELGKHIVGAGWDNWRDAKNEKTARYAEYHNSGEGAKADNRVKWAKQLSDKEAEKITTVNCYNLSKGWRLFE